MICISDHSYCLQVQEAVMNCQLPAAPHIVAPIREHGSSSIALKYLQNLSQRMAGSGPAPAATGAAASIRSWFSKMKHASSSSSSSGEVNDVSSAGSAAVLKPEFLVFRDVTSAVLTQVGYPVDRHVVHCAAIVCLKCCCSATMQV
jgi:hypothetical protein